MISASKERVNQRMRTSPGEGKLLGFEKSVRFTRWEKRGPGTRTWRKRQPLAGESFGNNTHYFIDYLNNYLVVTWKGLLRLKLGGFNLHVLKSCAINCLLCIQDTFSCWISYTPSKTLEEIIAATVTNGCSNSNQYSVSANSIKSPYFTCFSAHDSENNPMGRGAVKKFCPRSHSLGVTGTRSEPRPNQFKAVCINRAVSLRGSAEEAERYAGTACCQSWAWRLSKPPMTSPASPVKLG